MAIARVQTNLVTNTSVSNPQTATYTSTTTTGNLLLVVIFSQAVTVSAFSDNKSNTWTQYSSMVNYNGSWSKYVYICANATGGASHQISITPSGTGWPIWIGLHEFSGAATSSPIESETATTSITSNASSSSPTSGAAITTTNANDYVMGVFDATTTTTFTASTGWTLLNAGNSNQTFGTVGTAETTATSYTPQVLSAITGWSERAWSLAIIAGVVAPAAGPKTLNNYQFVKVGNGMSASEKIK